MECNGCTGTIVSACYEHQHAIHGHLCNLCVLKVGLVYHEICVGTEGTNCSSWRVDPNCYYTKRRNRGALAARLPEAITVQENIDLQLEEEEEEETNYTACCATTVNELLSFCRGCSSCSNCSEFHEWIDELYCTRCTGHVECYDCGECFWPEGQRTELCDYCYEDSRVLSFSGAEIYTALVINCEQCQTTIGSCLCVKYI